MSPLSIGDDSKAICEGWSKIVKDVRIVRISVDQDERWPGAAPVEIVETYSVGGDEAALMRRGIRPGCCLRLLPWCCHGRLGQQTCHNANDQNEWQSIGSRHENPLLQRKLSAKDSRAIGCDLEGPFVLHGEPRMPSMLPKHTPKIPQWANARRA